MAHFIDASTISASYLGMANAKPLANIIPEGFSMKSSKAANKDKCQLKQHGFVYFDLRLSWSLPSGWTFWMLLYDSHKYCLIYSISQEICTRFWLCCACCGYTLTDFPISIRLTSLALWQSNDCPSASKATLMNMDKYFMWIHYERLQNHNKAKHNKTVCIFLGIYCMGVFCW